MALKKQARVTKKRTTSSTGKTTRYSSTVMKLQQLVDSNSASNSASKMESGDESQEYFDAPSQPMDKGKGKERAIEPQNNRQIFRLMDLPPEIRLEIYRACLTRPWKILLSKPDQAATVKPDEKTPDGATAEYYNEDEDDEQESMFEAYALYQNLRTRRLITTDPFNTNTAQGQRAIHFITRAMRQSRATRPSSAHPVITYGVTYPSGSTALVATTQAGSSTQTTQQPTPARPLVNQASPADPLVINILRVNQEVYKEARAVLYSENVFTLNLANGVYSLAALHQRSRRHIKHIEIEIPTYTEILERFSEIVRLGLRYCSGLKKFVVHTPFKLPDGNGGVSSSNTTVYANGFDILRWLPQQCGVVMDGTANVEIDNVVSKHLTLAKSQDRVSYASSQLISKLERT